MCVFINSTFVNNTYTTAICCIRSKVVINKLKLKLRPNVSIHQMVHFNLKLVHLAINNCKKNFLSGTKQHTFGYKTNTELLPK